MRRFNNDLVLLRECLERAFAQCSPEALVLLRLRYLHGLTQRELAFAYGRRKCVPWKHTGICG